MSATRRLWLRAAGAATAGLGLLVVFSCNTPFIPIPPPADPTFTRVVLPDGMGGTRTAWEVRGAPAEAAAGAKVSAFNVALGVGVIARARPDGSYVAGPLDGRPGDRIELQYETPKGELSEIICRPLQEGLARTPCP